jgi:hypothetical protein
MKIPVIAFSTGLLVSCLALWGCPNPNSIGVQTFGYVLVTCVQASNNQPAAGALVSVDGQVGPNTSSSGTSLVGNIAVGTNIPASCNAPGLSGSAIVPSLTAANTQTNPLPITIQMSPS